MPVIEEVDDDDIDQKHYSIDDFDSHNPFSKDTPVDPDAPVQLIPTQPTSRPQTSPSNAFPSENVPSGTLPGPSFGNVPMHSPDMPRPNMINPSARIPEHMKKWSVIYPVYFDKTKTVKQGRRVPMEFAVNNPLATVIGDACQSLGYTHALEINKTHPKDWANTGRVRVELPKGVSKNQVYSKISKYLKANPANSQNAREQMYKQIAQFDSITPLAVPRNMSIPKILPGISPALSARKIIDDMMKMDGNQMAKMMGMG